MAYGPATYDIATDGFTVPVVLILPDGKRITERGACVANSETELEPKEAARILTKFSEACLTYDERIELSV